MNAFDVETFVNKNSFYEAYCVCYNINDEKKFHYYNDFSNLIEGAITNIFNIMPGNEIYFYVHNLDFDGLLIISSLSQTKKYLYTTFIRNLSFYKLEIILNFKKIIFICSYKLLPISLKKIAPSFTNLEKLPFPYKFVTFSTLFYIGLVPIPAYWNANKDYERYICLKGSNIDIKEYSIQYCLNDVEITCLFVNKLLFLISDFKITLKNIYSGPALALKIFIKKFNFNKISFAESGFYDKLVRAAYYGGRCEVYGNPYPDEYVFYYDFSGMYAQCMQEKFAFGKYKIKTSQFNLSNPGFYWIEYASDCERPVLPIHHPISNKLVFFNGQNLKGCYWFEEIQLFLNKGGKINKILYGLEYENFDFIFNDYVEYFTNIKNKGDAFYYFGKNMNNFLYGRLGLTEADEHTFFINEKDFDYFTNWKKYNIKNIIKINNIYMISVELTSSVKRDFNLKKSGKFKKNIGLAAAITSKARIKLYKAQDSVQNNKGRLLYSDTDSIFAAYTRDVTGEKHGDIVWKPIKTNTIIKDAVFINPKTYALKYSDESETVKIKGFDSSSIVFDDLKKLFYNKQSVSYVVENTKKLHFELKRDYIKKTLNLGNYDKRLFTDNFKTTEAIRYDFNN